MEALCAGEDLRLVGGEESRAHRTESRGRAGHPETRATGKQREEEGGRSPRTPRLKTTIHLSSLIIIFVGPYPAFPLFRAPSDLIEISPKYPQTVRHHRPRPSPRIRLHLPRIPASPATPTTRLLSSASLSLQSSLSPPDNRSRLISSGLSLDVCPVQAPRPPLQRLGVPGRSTVVAAFDVIRQIPSVAQAASAV